MFSEVKMHEKVSNKTFDFLFGITELWLGNCTTKKKNQNLVVRYLKNSVRCDTTAKEVRLNVHAVVLVLYSHRMLMLIEAHANLSDTKNITTKYISWAD